VRVSRSTLRAVRLAVVILAVTLLCVAIARQWDAVVDALHQMGARSLGLSLVAALLGLLFTGFAWRAVLADLGSPVPVRAGLRVFFLAQIGKYLPGSIWSFVAQMELGRSLGVPRRRSGLAVLLFVGLHCATGLLVAAATLPVADPETARRYWWLMALAPAMLVLVHPRVLRPVLNRLLRLLHREPLERTLSLRGTATACGYLFATWLWYGLSVYALAAPLGIEGTRGVMIATGGYGLAWSAGVLTLGLLPVGIGVREAVLTAALLPVLPLGAATAVAAASRVVQTLGDAIWATIAALSGRSRRVAAKDSGAGTTGEADKPGGLRSSISTTR
jgi:glycosyltransferase 2 family protein